MQVDTWCAQHNLPQPTDGTVPMETAIYVAVCLSRRNRDLPDEVLVYLVRLSLGCAEA